MHQCELPNLNSIFTLSFHLFLHKIPLPISHLFHPIDCIVYEYIHICTRILAIPLSHLLYKSRLSLYRTCYQTVPCTTYLYQPPLIFLLFLCPIAYPPANFDILYIYYHSDPPPTSQISPIFDILAIPLTDLPRPLPSLSVYRSVIGQFTIHRHWTIVFRI